MAKNLFVGSLPFSLTEDALNQLFAQHGQVLSAKIINDKYKPTVNNVNNGNREKSNNANNVNSNKRKYALDKNKFVPHTEESLLAEEIATELKDLDNFACYYNVVNKIGVSKARMIFSQTLGEIKEKAKTKYPVRKPASYFMWKVKNGH